MFVSKTLLSEAGLKPSFLSLIIPHMDIRDIWPGSLEPAGILRTVVYWEARGNRVSWIHTYNKHATHLIAQQDWGRRFYVPEFQVVENRHWFKFSIRIWLYLFNQGSDPHLLSPGNVSTQLVGILILFLFGFTWTNQIMRIWWLIVTEKITLCLLPN